MSKKLAGGAGVICLDVKVGDGGFFKTSHAAHQFALLVFKIGGYFKRNVRTVMTPMDQPLGYAVGNALEMREVLDVLERNGAPPRDLLKVVRMLGVEILCAARLAGDEDEACELLLGNLEDGEALRAFDGIVSAQGGSLSAFRESLCELDKRACVEIRAVRDGVLLDIDALKIGEFVRTLGAGRYSLVDSIDPFAGIVFKRKSGGDVAKGETLAMCYFDPEWPSVQRIYNGSVQAIEQTAIGAFSIGQTVEM
jgi:pyrimidine-nucleoside phosphorylase